MTTIYMWVLVINAYGSNSMPVISQPVADLPSCERMQKVVQVQGGLAWGARNSQCVQVSMLVPK